MFDQALNEYLSSLLHISIFGDFHVIFFVSSKVALSGCFSLFFLFLLCGLLCSFLPVFGEYSQTEVKHSKYLYEEIPRSF